MIFIFGTNFLSQNVTMVLDIKERESILGDT